MIKFFDDRLAEFQTDVDSQRDNQLTLEHYTEKYLPILMQGMIIKNLELVLDEAVVRRLQSEENQLYMKMQRSLMDMTEFSNGSLLDNIVKINEKLSKKLKVKIDLRT